MTIREILENTSLDYAIISKVDDSVIIHDYYWDREQGLYDVGFFSDKTAQAILNSTPYKVFVDDYVCDDGGFLRIYLGRNELIARFREI